MANEPQPVSSKWIPDVGDVPVGELSKDENQEWVQEAFAELKKRVAQPLSTIAGSSGS